MTKTLSLAALVGAIFITALCIISFQSQIALGSAPSGLPATIATSSYMAVGTTQSRIFATSSCSARVITTYQNPIMLTFSEYDDKVPSAIYGHLQAASTTVSYDSGIYGCHSWRAYGYVGTVSITVTESR